MAQSVEPISINRSANPFIASATIAPPGSIVHVSAQYGSTKDGKIATGYESQIQLALLRLRRIIVAAGAEIPDICKLTLSIVNYDHENRMHERHIKKFLGMHQTALTVMPVSALAIPGALFQVEAVMIKGPRMIPIHIARQISSPTEKTYDVIVVGAGLSGLAAARDCVEAGFSILVLEARDRVGGKTYSQEMPKSGAIVEYGGAWFNNTSEARMTALLKKYKLDAVEQNVKGNAILQDHNGMTTIFPYGTQPNFEPEAKEHVKWMGQTLDDDCQKVDIWDPEDPDLDRLNLADYVCEKKGASDLAMYTVSTWTRAMLGQEPRDISALYFLNYSKSFAGGLLQLRSDEEDGGQYLRCRQGVQNIAKGIASDLPSGSVRLGEPVYSIRQTDSGFVEVTSPKGAMFARKVILSTPSAAYKTIDFQPPLPEDKIVLANSSHFGYYTKVMLMFKTPFWIERGFCGLVQSFIGPAAVMRDTSMPEDGKHVLSCFLAGDNGRTWSLLPPEERLEQVLNQVARLFADRETVDRELIEHADYDWSTEQYSGWGCPCPSYGPGVLDTVGHALRTPAGNLHFVGVETAGDFKGFMEGAVRSGERGAAEVIKLLSDKKANGIPTRDAYDLNKA